jgi:hypothetical protein
MAEYTIRDLWERERMSDKARTGKQIERAEKELLEGMTVVDGLNSEFWKLIKRDFLEPKMNDDRIDTAEPDDLLAIQRERRVIRELLKFLEEKAKAGNRASRFLKTIKQKSD